jgi:hypothetical protein
MKTKKMLQRKDMKVGTYAREAFEEVVKKENDNIWYKGKKPKFPGTGNEPEIPMARSSGQG